MSLRIIIGKTSYFLKWNFDQKSGFVVFLHEWNEWKKPQFNFLSQNLSIERHFFKWDGNATKISVHKISAGASAGAGKVRVRVKCGCR